MVLMNLWYVPYGLTRLLVMAAHPERYSFYAKDIVRYCERFKEKGGKVQVNILSFAGFYGKEAMMGARKLCNAALADYYAGDIHSLHQEILMEKYIGGAW